MPVVLIAALALTGATYVPSETRVLIVPPVNASGDKFEDMKKAQVSEARDTARDRFLERGFDVLSIDDSEAITKASGIDLTDEENRRKDNLFKLAELAKARLVMFSVIEHTMQRTVNGWLVSKLEGSATVKTWLLDASGHTAIMSAVKTEGKSNRNGPTGSMRQIRAVRLAVDDQLKAFMKDYPLIKKSAGVSAWSVPGIETSVK